METLRGRIKAYFSDRGYGFISCNGRADLFFSIKDVLDNDLKTGDFVSFEIGQYNNRNIAITVKKVL